MWDILAMRKNLSLICSNFGARKHLLAAFEWQQLHQVLIHVALSPHRKWVRESGCEEEEKADMSWFRYSHFRLNGPSSL